MRGMKRRGGLLLGLLFLFSACSAPESEPRVFILGLDGLDPRIIDLLMSEGDMPNFARLRQEGAYGRLRSQKPLLSPIVWTTIATGKGPEQHGIGHFVAVDSETGEELPATSGLRRVKALWNMVSDAGKQVATVGWWATWPPEEINGAVVSDHVAYHFLFEEGFSQEDSETPTAADRTHPPDLYERIAPYLRRPADLSSDELTPFVSATSAQLNRSFDFRDDLAHFKWALATAESYRDIGLALWRDERPDLGMVYIEGTDSASHLFGHLFRAEGLAGELAEQQRQFGRTVEAMYLYADRMVGEVMAELDADTTLIVLSDHGFELGVLHDDPSKTRDLRRVSERFHRIEGILYLWGRGVKQNARLDGPSILDVAPTVLTLLGLPPATDMPGRVIDEALRGIDKVERIATWEGSKGDSSQEDSAAQDDPSADPSIRQAQREHLESLGYLGGSGSDESSGPKTPRARSPEGERNLAAIHFEAGRYREAAESYLRLVEQEPQDASLRASLAGALGALGRYSQALEELNRAIEIEPLNVEAFHNRAVIRERLGEREQAIADYATALRYQPQYEPSRQALRRLTGKSGVRTPANPAEQRAADLVERASEAARRADYPQALELLAAAEEQAPGYILIYQYRSNVAYLLGDTELAIKALERGLELEPDNALFRTNLERLRAEPNDG